jgi:arylsulfatase A-like enzyme
MATAAASRAATCSALPAGKRPNFIVILADDMGWDDIGLHHPRGPDSTTSAGAQTPNIDRLIQNGMSFTRFYSSPLCAVLLVGRAQLLTGRDPVRTGNLYNT